MGTALTLVRRVRAMTSGTGFSETFLEFRDSIFSRHRLACLVVRANTPVKQIRSLTFLFSRPAEHHQLITKRYAIKDVQRDLRIARQAVAIHPCLASTSRQFGSLSIIVHSAVILEHTVENGQLESEERQEGVHLNDINWMSPLDPKTVSGLRRMYMKRLDLVENGLVSTP